MNWPRRVGKLYAQRQWVAWQLAQGIHVHIVKPDGVECPGGECDARGELPSVWFRGSGS